MQCEYSTWSSDQLHIRFDQVGKTVKEAEQFEAKAKRAIGRMRGSPWTRVIRSNRVITIELKYSRRKVNEIFGSLSSDGIAKRVETELSRKLR